MKAFDDFITPSKSIQKVSEKHAVAAVFGQVDYKFGRVDLVTDQFDVFNQPSHEFQLGLLIYRMHHHLFLLNIERLHLFHDFINIVNWCSRAFVAPLSNLLPLLWLALVGSTAMLVARWTVHTRW